MRDKSYAVGITYKVSKKPTIHPPHNKTENKFVKQVGKILNSNI